MAAYAAVTSLMYILEQIQHHPCPPISIEIRHMRSLCQNFSVFQDFLENYSHRDILVDCKEALETQIADATYAAEDVIESHIVDQIHAGSSNNDGGKSSNNRFIQDLRKAIRQMTLIKKEVQEKIREINDDQMPRNIISVSGDSPTAPPTRKNVMVGFDDLLNKIMDRLTGNQPNLQFLPIVGMGGSGKTTLAKSVYDNLIIVKRFEIRIWITMSQECRFRNILIGAISSLWKGQKNENLESHDSHVNDWFDRSESEIGEHLHKSLFGRRYLIVLDDMWSIEACEKLKLFFPDNNNGSRIMITTRISNVSNHFGSCDFKMNFLDEDKSWDLLCKIVYPQESCPLELKESGKNIARNCKGLPLSIVVIGGFLATSAKSREHWEYVAKNLNSIVNLDGDRHCMKILSLSYSQLPMHLKPCFLYMGVFPEDSEILVSVLIKLWAAEGFLKPIKAKSLEMVAKAYLNDLIDRNLILVHKWGSSGNIKFCKIHDLLRDLCLREARKDKFLYIPRGVRGLNSEGLNSQRRVCIHDQSILKEYVGEVIRIRPPVGRRALLGRSFISDFRGVFSSRLKFRLLRVFKVIDKYSYIHLKKGDELYSFKNIFKLVNSRYLSFRAHWGFNSEVPSSMHLLWNLQTLIVKDTWGKQIVAPPEIWKMSQLRHLQFDWLILPDPPNVPILEGEHDFILKNLQTLSGIRDFKLTEEVIKRIPNIKKLRLHYVSFPEEWSCNYCLNNLARLNQLESLACIFFSPKKSNHRIELLQNFALPRSLKKLTLRGSNLLWEDMRMIGSLPYLQVLKLENDSFGGPNWDPVEGEFLRLKFLLIEWCEDLVCWTADQTHFPCLEHLVLEQLKNLKEIPLNIGEIPTLQSIELIHCSNSTVISAKYILEEQENIYAEDVELQVRVLSLKNTQLEDLASNNFQVQTT